MITEPPDSHYFLAAVGWLELGNPQEALAETEHISTNSIDDPELLELKWKIYSELKEWEKAHEVAEKLIDVAPDRPSGWINRSFCLHEMKETQKAYSLLFQTAEKFPNEPIIPYNLACYSCQLGKLEEARNWLKISFCIAFKKEEIKEMALIDPDLKPLWNEIKDM